MKQEEGREALDQFAATGRYLFHGSQVADIVELEPHITNSKAEREDGGIWVQNRPVVSATANIDVAIFAATIWRRGVGTSGWYSKGGGNSATFEFNASEGVIAEVIKQNVFGYVYVLPKEKFKPILEIPSEFQSEVAVKPLAVIRVHATDLHPDVRTLKPDTHKH